MKKLLLLLIFIPFFAFSQIPSGINYQAIAYDSDGFEIADQNMTIRLGIILGTSNSDIVYSETHDVLTNNFGLFTLIISEGESSDNFSSINWENGAYLKVEFDQNQDGEFELLGIHSFSSVPYSLFTQNIPSYYLNQLDSFENIIETVSQYFGCKDYDACNYNSEATMSDNSCIYADEGYYCNGDCMDTDNDGICDLDEIEGCTDSNACNYVIGATNEDGSCQYYQEYYNCQGVCENDDDGDGVCDELEEGCTDESAHNYNPQALLSTSCIYLGCTESSAINFNPLANQDDGSCVLAQACPYPEYLEYNSQSEFYSEELCLTWTVEGCTNELALNFNVNANLDDGSCEHIYGCMQFEADNFESSATSDDGSCIISGCTDENASNFNQFATFNDGNCIYKVEGCINKTATNYNPSANYDNGSCIIYGCKLDTFPNFNSEATLSDFSCDMNSQDVFGCTDLESLNYNSNANIENGTCYIIPIGTVMDGGIVFYVDLSGSHGLIAAPYDIDGLFQSGETNSNFSGTIESIGSGHYNSISYANSVNFNYGNYSAAQAALIFSYEGYNDYYLPSNQELILMSNNIGQLSSGGNIGNFQDTWYWSSTKRPCSFNCGGEAWPLNFQSGSQYDFTNGWVNLYKVRAIRSF